MEKLLTLEKTCLKYNKIGENLFIRNDAARGDPQPQVIPGEAQRNSLPPARSGEETPVQLGHHIARRGSSRAERGIETAGYIKYVGPMRPLPAVGVTLRVESTRLRLTWNPLRAQSTRLRLAWKAA